MRPPGAFSPLAWPALIGLAAVILLSTGLMLYDISRDVTAQARTEELVDKALGSVSRIDDLRHDLHTVATDPDTREALSRVAHDTAAYDALATYPGEREEWARSRQLLDRLQRGDARLDQPLLDQLDASLDHIVAINRTEAARTVDAIRASFHEDFAVDAIGGTLALLFAVAVGAAILRSVRQQRTLLAEDLARKSERYREVEAFSGRVAHDLRGPLAPMRVWAELLETGGGPPPREIARRIESAVQRMTGIIDELLALSLSGQAGEGETEVAPVVAQVLDDNRNLLETAHVNVAITADKVHSPPASLCRVVQNLVSNAIKYRHPDRPLELGITATRDANEVEIVVSDNGVGMDEGTAASAFDPLFRGDVPHGVPGHGLGLAIVKRTVEALGGTCRIVSKLGEGTRFVLHLPAAG